MSISTRFIFTPAEIAEQRALNRRLARLPRLGVVGPARRAFVRAALRAGTIGADRRLRREGLRVEMLAVTHRGRTLTFRVIHPAEPPRGIVFDVHGGAWAFGSPAMNDLPNVAIAARGPAIVLSLDYALALPRPIAALQRECADALDWLLRREDGPYANLPVVLAGESAGAHLVLCSAMAARHGGDPFQRLRGMLLHCGAYDLGGSPSAQTAGPNTLILHGPSLETQMERLLPGLDATARRTPALSPLFADLTHLPPSLIPVGDIDPLRDDSTMLAEAITAAGGTAELALLPEAPHASMHLPGRYATRLREGCADWIGTRFNAQK